MLVWLRISGYLISRSDSQKALRNGSDESSWLCWEHAHHAMIHSVDESGLDLSILVWFARAAMDQSHSCSTCEDSWSSTIKVNFKLETAHYRRLVCYEPWIANAPLTINGAPSLPRGPWSHIRYIPFLDTCALIFLVTLFGAWHASEFVPTPYKLKVWPGLTIPPPPVTCAILMMFNLKVSPVVVLCCDLALACSWTAFKRLPVFSFAIHQNVWLPDTTFLQIWALLVLVWARAGCAEIMGRPAMWGRLGRR